MNGHREKTDKESGDPEAASAEAEELAETDTTDADVAEAAEDPLAALQAKADENWDSYLRLAAELENVRKRAARDVENARKFALERFARELLSVRDSLELGLASAASADAEQLRTGSEATLNLLISTMERFGVTEFDPHGEPFDPELHEAMTTQPSTEVEPGSILEVFQKGYCLNSRLLRPARVLVAQEPPEGDDKE